MPEHLKTEIKKITKRLDDLNYDFSMKILKKIKIRHGLKPEEVIFLLDVIQNMLNEKFYGKAQGGEEIEELSQEYNKTTEKWIDIMLYGILETE